MKQLFFCKHGFTRDFFKKYFRGEKDEKSIFFIYYR